MVVGLAVSPSPPPPIPLAVVFVVVVERLLPHIPSLLLPTVFFFSPPQVLRRFASSSLLFSFSSSFFVVFVVFIPRADRSVIYISVLEKLADLVDSSQRVSDVLNTCGRGEFDGCEGRIRPFLDDTL